MPDQEDHRPPEEHPFETSTTSAAGGRQERSLDALAKELASGDVSRRRALKLMGAAIFGGLLASIPGVASAAPCEPGTFRCGRKCCPQEARCVRGQCVCPANVETHCGRTGPVEGFINCQCPSDTVCQPTANTQPGNTVGICCPTGTCCSASVLGGGQPVCRTLEQGGTCGCILTPEGTTACLGDLCSTATTCTTSSECPEGAACEALVEGGGRCRALCGQTC